MIRFARDRLRAAPIRKRRILLLPAAAVLLSTGVAAAGSGPVAGRSAQPPTTAVIKLFNDSRYAPARVKVTGPVVRHADVPAQYTLGSVPPGDYELCVKPLFPAPGLTADFLVQIKYAPGVIRYVRFTGRRDFDRNLLHVRAGETVEIGLITPFPIPNSPPPKSSEVRKNTC